MQGTVNMPIALRLAAAAAASIAGLAAIMMVMWPAWPQTSGFLLPWQSAGWRLYLASPDGLAHDLPGRPFLLIAITALLAITLLSISLSVIGWPGDETAGGGASARGGDIDSKVSAELVKLIALVRGHLEANGLFGAALARANDQLPSLANPDQIRMVVSYLMLENENMRKKTANLQANLETSKRQVDQLKSNLAVAKVEGLSDALTSVKNRRAFDLALASELSEARNTTKPLSLIMTDIDHFKKVNDSYGHQTGDEVLKWFAQLLGRNVKGRDIVARYGGEEFMIILPQTPADTAARLAGQIKAQIESRDFTMLGNAKISIKLTASFGVAQWRDGEGTDALIKRVDAKLYEAKAGGRNRVAA
jgi:diguanylate cyclase